jgi:hypothetical protein
VIVLPRVPELQRRGFNVGVKSSLDPSSIPPNGLWEARNVRSNGSGLLTNRGGVKSFLTSLGNGTIQGAESSFGDILLSWNRSLYRVDDNATSTLLRQAFLGSVDTDEVEMIRWARNGSEITYLFAGNGIFETTGANAPLVTPYTPATGEDPNLLNDGVGNQDLTSGPAKSKFAVLRASLSQRIAVAGDPDSPNTVYLSAVLDATYFPTEQIIQLPDDGSKIVGLENWYNALIIFRDTDIWAFFGSDLSDAGASLVLQDSSTGCLTHRSIQNVPNVGLVFLGKDNIYALQGVSGIEDQVEAIPIGDDILKYLKKAMSDGLGGVCSIYHDREYKISFPDAVEPERVFVLSLQNQMDWYMDTGPLTSVFVEHENKLYGASRTEGSLHLFDETIRNDEGRSIPFYVAFRREDLSAGIARIKRVLVLVNSKKTIQDLKVTIISDGGEIEVKEFNVKASANSNFSIGESNIGQGAIGRMEAVKVYEYHIRPSLKGQFAQIRISSNEPDQEIAILGYAIDHSPSYRAKGSRKEVT